jgi:hypothetical protein
MAARWYSGVALYCPLVRQAMGAAALDAFQDQCGDGA